MYENYVHWHSITSAKWSTPKNPPFLRFAKSQRETEMYPPVYFLFATNVAPGW